MQPHEYAEDLAKVLERLLSQLSLDPMNDYVQAAYTQAKNVLEEYEQAMDVQDAAIKTELGG